MYISLLYTYAMHKCNKKPYECIAYTLISHILKV